MVANLSGTGPAADTHCPYCALQCAMALRTQQGGLPVEVTPRDFPTNRGGLCRKGWTSAAVLDAPGRLTTPLVRDDRGQLQEASWEQAYARIVDTVTALRAEDGPDALAVFGGGGLTNEKAYQLGKFARVALGTRFVDYNGRFCMSSAAAAGNRAFGIDRGLPFPLADLGGAAAILLLGSNVAETMPPLVQHLAGARSRGGLIVVDPRRSATAALTDSGAGMHLQALPGTDLTLLLGLAHLVAVQGGTDPAYLDQRTRGSPDVLADLAQWWPERVERETGVAAEDLRRAADLLIAASPKAGGAGAYVLTGRGAEQHVKGTDTVHAAINLALLLGLPGRVGSGYGALTGQGNGQGGREHGQKADQLPGYRRIDDPHARRHVAQVWGVPPESIPGPGVPAVELIERLGRPGGPRALFVHGSNLLVSAPDATRARERIRALDLLVVCDVVMSETAALADVVLPVTQWAEEDGTMTTLEGRVVRRRRAINPPADVRDELAVLSELAEQLDAPAAFSADPSEVFDELARASAGGPADYSGLSYPRLDRGDPEFWPCPSAEHPGTPRMFLDRFGTPDGRAVLHPVEPGPVHDDVRADAPLYLVTGRVLGHYQSGAQTRRVAELAKAEPTAYVQIHPLTAARLDIAEGELVSVRSSRGEARGPARLSTRIRQEVVFMPFHFPDEQCVNAVTDPATDPTSGMPQFKVCAVSVCRAEGSS